MRKHQRAQQKKLNAAWSNDTTRKEERDKRKEKKERKKKWEKMQRQAATEEDKGGKRARSPSVAVDDNDGDDWDELAREERMAKKVKKGDVSQGEFDREFADL